MRDYKKALVAGALAMSMLVGQAGHTDVTASSVKKPYYKTNVNTDYLVEDADLYEETGEVVSFYAKYTTTWGSSPNWVYAKYGDAMGEKDRPLTGYMMCGKEKYSGDFLNLDVIDNTNSVTKIVLDGKKSFKLNKSKKASKKDDLMWHDFGDLTESQLKIKWKWSTKLKIPNGKHTLTITDKHGHKSVLKVWKDTKKPKIKIFKKGGKYYCKITDNAGIDTVNSKKISKNGKIIKSYTVKGRECKVVDIAGNYSYGWK